MSSLADLIAAQIRASLLPVWAQIKQDIAQGGGGQFAWHLCTAAQITGTTPLLTSGGYLPAGDYGPLTAILGCGYPTYTATLKLKTDGGATLLTLSSTGGVARHTTADGFSLAASAFVELTLEASHPSATAYARGVCILPAT